MASAERLYLQILASHPRYFKALQNLAIIRFQQQRFIDALKLIDAALSVDAGAAGALSDRGTILYQLRDFEKAVASCDQALELAPANAETLICKGLALQSLKRFDDALACYTSALDIDPKSVAALNNHGAVLMALRRHDEAFASFQAALTITPDSVQTLDNCGIALREQNRFAEALAYFEAALALCPLDLEVLINRGIALTALQRFQAALACYAKVLAAKPDHADVLFHRANALWEMNRREDALADYRKAWIAKPDHPYALGGLSNAALRLCDWEETAKLAPQIRAHISAGKPGLQPGVVLGYCDDPALMLRCAQIQIQNRVGPPRPLGAHGGAAPHGEKIRLAYLSPDFNRHATAYLMAELIKLHDRTGFEISGISFGADDGSDERRDLMAAFDHFHDVRTRSDLEVAKLLGKNGVHIAVDLNGHMQHSRMGILGYRPCPVQVNYLGFPGTSGADFVDYIIADKIVAPLELQPFFTEKIVHLPNCYQVNDSRRRPGRAAPLSRQTCGLPDHGFVFCCFNANWKITAPVFEIWMRLLIAVPDSVLWLLADDSATCARLMAAAGARGIGANRLVFAPRMSSGAHLARHRLADLFLDTLPYNAHTTASDALRMGVPIVTCPGRSFQSRVAASLLNSVGLKELVVPTLAEYETLALALALDTDRLKSVRAGLTGNSLTSPLFDSALFCRHIEAAYRTMHGISQRGDAPASFAVPNEV